MSHKQNNRDGYGYKYNKYKTLYQNLVGGANSRDKTLNGLSNKDNPSILNKQQPMKQIKLNSMDGYSIELLIENRETTINVKHKIKKWYADNKVIDISIENINIFHLGNEDPINDDVIFPCSSSECFVLLEPEKVDPHIARIESEQEAKRIEKQAIIRQNKLDKEKSDREVRQQVELEQLTRKYGVKPTELFGPELIGLNGANLLYYYPDIYGRKVLLLGETHITNGCDQCEISNGCMDIDTYVNSLIEEEEQQQEEKNRNGCIDFYVEDKYPNILVGGSKNSNQRNINTTRDYWNSKLSGVSNIPYLRLHKWDLRQDNNSNLTTPFIHAFDNHNINRDGVKNITEWVRVQRVTLDILLTNIARYTINGKSSRVDTGLVTKFVYEICGYRLSNWDIRYQKNRIKINRAVDKLAETIHRSRDEIIDEFISYWKITIMGNIKTGDVDSIIHDFGLLTTDLYLLSRMFTTFKYDTTTKLDRTPIGCGIDYKTPKNIIVFAGQNHIKFIHTMIHVLYPNIPRPSPISSINKCINFNHPIRFF